MKASKLLEVFENYFDNRYTPSDEGIRYGCECGCGGDYYSEHPEEWDKDHEIVYKAREELFNILKEISIEIDIDEYGNKIEPEGENKQ